MSSVRAPHVKPDKAEKLVSTFDYVNGIDQDSSEPEAHACSKGGRATRARSTHSRFGAVCTVSKGSGTVTRATRLECLRTYVPTNYPRMPTNCLISSSNDSLQHLLMQGPVSYTHLTLPTIHLV